MRDTRIHLAYLNEKSHSHLEHKGQEGELQKLLREIRNSKAHQSGDKNTGQSLLDEDLLTAAYVIREETLMLPVRRWFSKEPRTV